MAGLWQVCPEDGGKLLENPDWDRLWCPSNRHGGNGKFFTQAEAREETMQTRKMRPQSGRGDNVLDQLARMVKAAAEAGAEAQAIADSATDAKTGIKITPDPAGMAAKVAPRPTPKTPKPCTCECGGTTKGGRYLPGHDSKHHARLAREAKGEA